MAEHPNTSRQPSPSEAPSPQNEDATITLSGVNGQDPIQATSIGLSPTSMSPDVFGSFDWDEFEKRYGNALATADARESDVLKEFRALNEYFNIWASTSAAHDDDRAVKRLQTRERFVTLAEDRMAQKQHHYAEVMKAFQSAMALLKADMS